MSVRSTFESAGQVIDSTVGDKSLIQGTSASSRIVRSLQTTSTGSLWRSDSELDDKFVFSRHGGRGVLFGGAIIFVNQCNKNTHKSRIGSPLKNFSQPTDEKIFVLSDG